MLKTMIAIGCSLPLTCIAQAEPIRYQLSKTSTPEKLQVTAHTGNIGEFLVDMPRENGSAQPFELMCKNDDGKHVITKNTTATCKELKWIVNFNEVSEHGLDIALQVNHFHPQKKWYFLTEWYSLPTLKVNGLPVEIELCLPGYARQQKTECFTLPNATQAPSLTSWGMPNTKIEVNGSSFLLQSDIDIILEQSELWLPTFEAQLRYLFDLFNQDTKLDWTMTLYGRETSQGNVSGAAGFESITVNVPLSDGKTSGKTYPHMLKILAHETIHGLDTRTNHLWIAEGLAEYYAQKSYNHTQVKQPAKNEPFDALAQWQQLSTRLPFAKTGLMAANDAYINNNEQHNMVLFYTKAVAFWQSIDLALQQKKHQLDEFVLLPLSGEHFSLSTEFTEAVSVIIGVTKWQAILNDYL